MCERTAQLGQALPPLEPRGFVKCSDRPLGGKLHATLHFDPAHEAGVFTGDMSGRVPETRRPIFASGQYGLAVGTKRDAGDGPRVPQARPHGEACAGIPNAGCVIPASRQYEFTVRAKGDARHRAGMVEWKADRFQGRSIPQEDEPIFAGRGKDLAAGTEGNACDRPLMRQRSD